MNGGRKEHAQLSIECGHCNAQLVWPSTLSADEKRAFADVARGSRLHGTQYAKLRFGLDLEGAKALAFHVTRSHRGVIVAACQ
jgi:hypothetical protein